MHFLPLLLACQESLRSSSGTQYQDVWIRTRRKFSQKSLDFMNEMYHNLHEREVIILINEHRELVIETLSCDAPYKSLVSTVWIWRLGFFRLVMMDSMNVQKKLLIALSTVPMKSWKCWNGVWNRSSGCCRMWLESTGHRDNIEGPYTLSGIGSYERDDAIYFTQIFLSID